MNSARDYLRESSFGDDTGSAMWGVTVGLPLLSLVLGLVTASSVSENGVLARIRVPGAVDIATLAFSLYLTHKAVGHMVMQQFPRMTASERPASWLLYVVALRGCLCGSSLVAALGCGATVPWFARPRYAAET